MSDKFTAGTWRWWACKGGDRLPSSDYVQIASDNNHVAQVRIASVTEADLRLIAAAPDLLKAARLAEKVIDILWVSHHANRSDAALEELRAAIAKATGVQP